MKLVVEKIPDLQALYIKQLRMLLSAEELIASKSLFLMEMAMDDDLREALNTHWQNSERQAARLREMLIRITDTPGPIKCGTVYALFDEAEDLVQDAAYESIRNTALLAVARRIKHYELAFYEAVHQFAATLGRDDDARLLEESFREEIDTTQELTRIAERLSAESKKVA